VYAKAVSNFQRLKADALVVEESPSVYVYRQRMGAHVQTGVAACFSLDEYDSDAIKKHERTRRDKEDDRTRHLLALRAQTGPVFLIHRPVNAIDDALEHVAAAKPPLYDFTAPDGIQHTMWRVDAHDERSLVEAFDTVPELYIADGHHRAASAARARQELRGDGARGEWDSFLAVAFPATQVSILPYNRVVSDLGSLTPQTLLHALRERFTIKDGPSQPERKGEVAMFLEGRWYTIALGESPSTVAPTERLDVSRLQALVLHELLDISDARTSKRIDFVGGMRGAGELEKLVRSGRAAVAFSLFPVSADDLMTITDAGGIMPPKSTWFEPKLRDGLLSHMI
jgi:uncharacterized protein (DUF1015 family)